MPHASCKVALPAYDPILDYSGMATAASACEPAQQPSVCLGGACLFLSLRRRSCTHVASITSLIDQVLCELLQVTQFGYVAFFGVSFPLAALVCMRPTLEAEDLPTSPRISPYLAP